MRIVWIKWAREWRGWVLSKLLLERFRSEHWTKKNIHIACYKTCLWTVVHYIHPTSFPIVLKCELCCTFVLYLNLCSLLHNNLLGVQNDFDDSDNEKCKEKEEKTHIEYNLKNLQTESKWMLFDLHLQHGKI